MRRNAGSARQGFTVIELMIAVAIVGTLSALAVPAFSSMLNRSRTAETMGNLNSMFKSAASYYAGERSWQGQISSTAGHCTVNDAIPSPVVPGKHKQIFQADDSFRALGFTIADRVYYSYGMASQNGVSGCDHVARDASLYTFYANGDLDGDGIQSTYEFSAGSDDSNVLYHSRGFYIASELE
jgi:prepilin-type N-terminal cleavage/methylation domain-containing protein